MCLGYKISKEAMEDITSSQKNIKKKEKTLKRTFKTYLSKVSL